MPYLNELVILINEAIRTSSLTDKRFSSAKLEGIAVQVLRNGPNDAQEVFPAIVKLNEVERYIGVDDTYPLTIYHRILGNTYSEDAKQGQFGDGFTAQMCSTDALMVVFAKRSAIRMTAEQLEALLVAGFPDQFVQGQMDGLQIFSARATLTASTMDVFTVFSTEYRGTKFFLGPEDILFAMRYKIESRYRKSCFKICDFECE